MAANALETITVSREGVEEVYAGRALIALVVRLQHEPEQTEFLTTKDMSQQVGFICNPAGAMIAPHVHNPVRRTIVGTSEAIFVRRGRVRLDLYDEDRRLVTSRALDAGDLVFLVSGGHGFEILEDAVLLEVKQGPYLGENDKTRF